MFGFGKKKKKEEQGKNENVEQMLPLELPAEETVQKVEAPKVNTRLDKLIMGAIVGVAVGSVVGMAIAPKNEEENTKATPRNNNNRTKKPGLFGRFKRLGKKEKNETGVPLKKIPSEAPADEKK